MWCVCVCVCVCVSQVLHFYYKTTQLCIHDQAIVYNECNYNCTETVSQTVIHDNSRFLSKSNVHVTFWEKEKQMTKIFELVWEKEVLEMENHFLR